MSNRTVRQELQEAFSLALREDYKLLHSQVDHLRFRGLIHDKRRFTFPTRDSIIRLYVRATKETTERVTEVIERMAQHYEINEE